MNANIRLKAVVKYYKLTGKAKAFTLVELLVVISIIALLLAVLIPALQKAKAQAQMVICGNHVKQLLMAWSLYAIENSDHLVYAGTTYKVVNDQTDPRNKQRLNPWVLNASHPLNGSIAVASKQGCVKGALYRYTKNTEIYHCPADVRAKLTANDPPQGGIEDMQQWRSYSITDLMAGYYNWGHADSLNEKRRYYKMTEITRAADRSVFVEEGDWFPAACLGVSEESWAMRPIAPEGPKWIDTLATYHGTKAKGVCNIGYADGHARKLMMDDVTTSLMNDTVGRIWDRRLNNPLRPSATRDYLVEIYCSGK